MWILTNKILKFFTKYKLVDTTKFNILSKEDMYFLLNENLVKKVNNLFEEKGDMDYIFYFDKDSGKLRFKVKIWNTNEYIDIE